MLCRYPFVVAWFVGGCFDGCFAVVVAGLLFSRCLAAESMRLLPAAVALPSVDPGRMLCRRGSLAPSLVDALLPRVCWPCLLADVLPPWLFGPLSGRCFATESVLALSLGGCFAAVVAWFVGGCFAVVGCSFYRWMLCHLGLVFALDTIALLSFWQAQFVGLGC
jgi:hypothetical protein